MTAAVTLLLADGFLQGSALGYSEGLLVALGLLAAGRHLAGRPGQALALAGGAALLRPETWPFLALYGGWAFARRPGLRPLVVALAVAVPALWLGPELWASGDLLRSSERARIPNPGAPALAERPFLASLGVFAGLLPPLALAAPAALRRDPLVLALALAAPDVRRTAATLEHAAALHRDLGRAVETAGGVDRLLACGPPYAGRYRFPAIAWRLGVPISSVAREPSAPGVALRSRLTPTSAADPDLPDGFALVADGGEWDVLASCRKEAR